MSKIPRLSKRVKRDTNQEVSERLRHAVILFALRFGTELTQLELTSYIMRLEKGQAMHIVVEQMREQKEADNGYTGTDRPSN